MRSPCKRVLRSQVRRSRCHRLILALLATTTSPMARAQGTIYLSHLGTATDAGAPVASDSWWGTFFETGPVAGGYSLDSIQLRIAGISGNPFFTLVVSATPAPEPEIAPLTGLGMLAFAWARARKCRENPHSSAAA